MSDEQSIRDEFRQVIKSAIGYEPVLVSPGGLQHRTAADRDWLMERISDALTSSTVIRRIQAEALREAADEIAATFTDPDRSRPRHPQAKVSTDYVNDPQWAELIVRNRADTIERGEQS